MSYPSRKQLLRLAALYKAAKRKLSNNPETYLNDLFKEQREFVEDKSQYKVAICSRRAGKTHGSVAHMMMAANAKPEGAIGFLALTRTSVKRIVWNPLQEFNRKYNIGMKFNNTELTATLPNGTIIYCSGADSEKLIERFRGTKYSTVIVDEAASFSPSTLESLVDDVLDPAVMDLQGSIVIMGTPGAVPSGFFYDISTGKRSGWSLHHWTLVNNPFLPHAEEYLNKLLKNKGWNENHPTFQREWLGRWVRDLGSLVYPYDPIKNKIDRLPTYNQGEWKYILGIDFGFKDATAIVVLAYHEYDNNVYVIESEARNGVIPSEAATWTRKLQEKYPFTKIVGDVGGLGKGYAEEMRRRFAIPVQPAQKTDKRGFQELIAGDLKSGNIKVIHSTNKSLIEEWNTIQWNEERTKEDDRYNNHLADACLYAWRECKAYMSESMPEQTKPRHLLTEKERIQRLAEKEKEDLAKIKKKNNEDSFLFGDDDNYMIDFFN